MSSKDSTKFSVNVSTKVEDGNVHPMQHFVSNSEWDDDKILDKSHSLVNEDMGTIDGVLICDES